MRDSLIIMPSFNEEKNIAKIIQEIKKQSIDADVVVINDGSSDATELVAKREQVDVISLPFNLGYGVALQTGFKYAVRKGYKYIVQFDSDGQHDPSDIPIILDELKKNYYHIVIGSRFLGNGTLKTGLGKRLIMLLFSLIIKLSTGEKVTDPTSGLKGLSQPVFSYYSRMGQYPDDFPDADVLIQTIKCRFRVCEVPANMHGRMSGKGMHQHFSFKHLYYLLKIFLSIFIILLRGKMLREEYKNDGKPC